MSADDWPFRCAVLIRPSRGEVILRSGAKGFGVLLGTWPLEPDGIEKAKEEARKREKLMYDGVEMSVITQSEKEVASHERRLRGK